MERLVVLMRITCPRPDAGCPSRTLCRRPRLASESIGGGTGGGGAPAHRAPFDFGILTLAPCALHGWNGTKSRQCPPPPPLIEDVPLPLSERVALFARSTSFPIENMRSTEALEGTPVLNFANTYCNAGSLRKASTLYTEAIFRLQVRAAQ